MPATMESTVWLSVKTPDMPDITSSRFCGFTAMTIISPRDADSRLLPVTNKPYFPARYESRSGLTSLTDTSPAAQTPFSIRADMMASPIVPLPMKEIFILSPFNVEVLP